MAREVIRRRPLDRRDAAALEAKKQETELRQQLAEQIANFRQAIALQGQIKPLAPKFDQLKRTMKDFAIANGVPSGDKGQHRSIVFPEPITLGKKTYKGYRAQSSSSTYLDEETAERILKERGLYKQAVRTIEVLDQDEIFRLGQEENPETGKPYLSEDELAAMQTTTTKWSFYPEEADEDESDLCEVDVA